MSPSPGTGGGAPAANDPGCHGGRAVSAVSSAYATVLHSALPDVADRAVPAGRTTGASK